MAVAMATDDNNADSHIGGIGSRSITGSVHNSGGWVYSQLSSDTIRAFHGIADIRDEGMTGKDLGPMLLGVYSAVRGTFSSRCFRSWSVADRTYGRSDTESGSLQSRHQ